MSTFCTSLGCGRGLLTRVGCALIIVGALAVSAPPAAAQDTALVTCAVGAQVTSYSPGLLLFPRPVSFRSESIYALCVSPTDLAIRSGTTSATGAFAQRSCIDVLNSPAGRVTRVIA